MIRVIPIKNVDFNKERSFLSKMHQEGYKLKKRGILFYHFNKVAPQEVYYAIDLVDKEYDSQPIDGWEIVTKKKVHYKAKSKVYCCTTNKEQRLVTEMNTEYGYYKYNRKLFLALANLMIEPFLIALIVNTLIDVPREILIALVMGVIPSIYFFRVTNQYKNKVHSMSSSQGELTGMEAHYLITFKNTHVHQEESALSKLATLGFVERLSKEMIRIQTPLKQEELNGELKAVLNLDDSQFSVMHAGAMYFRLWL